MFNHIIHQLAISVLLLILFTRPAYAASYHVSRSGNTANNCTLSSPCTFSRAQSLAKSGDTIEISGTIDAISISKPGLTIKGGKVDGSNLTTANSAAIMITADNTTLENIEITNGWSYGFRTSSGANNVVAKQLNIHHNVRENFTASGGCNTTNTHGWGSAMRAYFSDGMAFRDSYVWENCGEGFSAVMSKNIHGTNLMLWDNWSVNAYPDQSENYSLTNSSIYCQNPLFQRLGKSRSILLGAEDGYGTTRTLTKNISITNNKIYNCKGVGSYKITDGDFSGITINNNQFYNTTGSIIENIPGSNIVINPNTSASLSPIPIPHFGSLTPIPSTSPDPSNRPGDLNGDGSINLQDFNQLITNFGNPYTIFDFNRIVSNYGS
ncbi:MAG: hypothetical protein E6P95_00770 [Candidatus Moraniibacteriota bacterium]|nr:MAG: hypothetical protein E6P95_00770 [Candidatus Moranbacteria bacterium]